MLVLKPGEEEGRKAAEKQKRATAGVKSCVAERELSHERFLDVLNGVQRSVSVEQTTIRSTKHRLETVKQNRVALFPADDKRWVCQDHTTRALGHHENAEWDTIDNISSLLDAME